MSFLMTKVDLNVLFSINQSVSHHKIMLLLPYVSQLEYFGDYRNILRPLFTPFIIFAPTTTQILVIKYFYVIDSI
jgi:hypothetical protein